MDYKVENKKSFAKTRAFLANIFSVDIPDENSALESFIQKDPTSEDAKTAQILQESLKYIESGELTEVKSRRRQVKISTKGKEQASINPEKTSKKSVIKEINNEDLIR